MMWLQSQRVFDYPEWDDMKGVLDNLAFANHNDFEEKNVANVLSTRITFFAN